MELAQLISTLPESLKRQHVHTNNLKGNIMKNAKTVAMTLFVSAGALLAGNAHAALDQAVVDGIQAEVIGDIGIATTAGFAILAVSLGATVGMSLIGRFISKGANGG